MRHLWAEVSASFNSSLNLGGKTDVVISDWTLLFCIQEQEDEIWACTPGCPWSHSLTVHVIRNEISNFPKNTSIFPTHCCYETSLLSCVSLSRLPSLLANAWVGWDACWDRGIIWSPASWCIPSFSICRFPAGGASSSGPCSLKKKTFFSPSW